MRARIVFFVTACVLGFFTASATPVADDDAVYVEEVVAVEGDSLALAEDFIADIAPLKLPHDDLYQYPYSMWRQCPNWKRLWQNTAVLFGAGFAALGVLELLPANTTAWNQAEMRDVPFFKRWLNHVKVGPVWDSDLPIFNYILHPYSGAAYYMAARSQGLNVLGSFCYVTFISTVFWEYGIEAFNEVPSIQDLIITPIGGLVLGEAFYLAKRRIVDNDYRLLGSPILGNAVAILIDPANEILGFIFGNSARQWCKLKRSLPVEAYSAWGPVGNGFGLNMSLRF